MKKIFLAISLVFILMCCKSIHKTSFYAEDDSVNLYAFIGKKISLKEINVMADTSLTIHPITGDTVELISHNLDSRFDGKYKVIANVFNDLELDTINFVAYDHYGKPAFTAYKYVMLYLSKDEKKQTFYHQKYLFDPVKKSKKGVWKGLKEQSIEELFRKKKDGVLKNRSVF